MIRELVRRPLCAVLRLFFRRLEVSGRERVPAGPVIFILNHPNALMDPLVLLCRAGRPVAFLAKEPLFRMPVIGLFVRAMDSIPVYRRMDQADPGQNAVTFAAARALLARGGSLALFPEGTSHSDPRLKPFRTGAARIALGARVDGLHMVPAGLFYTAKSRFRSGASLQFGEPVPVPVAGFAPGGEPAPDAVRALTSTLEDALKTLTVQADRYDALLLAEAAERIWSSATEGPKELAGRVELRRRLLEGYSILRGTHSARVTALERRILRYQAALDSAGLSPELLPATGYRPAIVARAVARGVLFLILPLPLALLGLVAHFPAWLATSAVATRFRRNPDVVSTVKALAGLLCYPLTWGILMGVATERWGLAGGGAAALLGPVSAYAALRFAEEIDRLAGGARGLVLSLTGRWRFLRLVAERKAIRDELSALGDELNRPATAP